MTQAEAEFPPWILVLPLVLIPVVFGGLLLLMRRGRPPGPSVVLGADRVTRRRVFRQVRRGQLPAAEPERSMAVEMAQNEVRLRWIWVLMMTIGVLRAGLGLVRGLADRPLSFSSAALGVGLAATAGWARYTRTPAARRLLARRGAPGR